MATWVGRTDGRTAERGLPRFGRFFKGGETGRVRRRNRPRHDRLSLKERGGEGFDAAAEAEAADFAVCLRRRRRRRRAGRIGERNCEKGRVSWSARFEFLEPP